MEQQGYQVRRGCGGGLGEQGLAVLWRQEVGTGGHQEPEGSETGELGAGEEEVETGSLGVETGGKGSGHGGLGAEGFVSGILRKGILGDLRGERPRAQC